LASGPGGYLNLQTENTTYSILTNDMDRQSFYYENPECLWIFLKVALTMLNKSDHDWTKHVFYSRAITVTKIITP
jgi:hypothetical protein